MFDKLVDIARLVDSQTRSISAENLSGAAGGGAQAAPGDDEHCAAAADRLGKGWKVRPSLLNIEPRRTVTLADVEGPGVVQHVGTSLVWNAHSTGWWGEGEVKFFIDGGAIC